MSLLALFKSHVKAHASHTKAGVPYQVADYDNKVVKKPVPSHLQPLKPSPEQAQAAEQAQQDAQADKAGADAFSAKLSAAKAKKAGYKGGIPDVGMDAHGGKVIATPRGAEWLKEAWGYQMYFARLDDGDYAILCAPGETDLLSPDNTAVVSIEGLTKRPGDPAPDFEWTHRMTVAFCKHQWERTHPEHVRALEVLEEEREQEREEALLAGPFYNDSAPDLDDAHHQRMTREIGARLGGLSRLLHDKLWKAAGVPKIEGTEPEGPHVKAHLVGELAERLNGDPGIRALARRIALNRGALVIGQATEPRTMRYANAGLLEHAAVNVLVRNWAGTSGDSDLAACAIQWEANDLFGLGEVAKNALKHSEDECRREFTDLEREGIRAYVRAVYDYTQDTFKKAGITRVPLARGVVLDDFPDGSKGPTGARLQDVRVRLQPLSSFAWSPAIARGFASTDDWDMVCVVFAASVPVERVWSTCYTGAGCHNEAEMIVLGGGMDDAKALVYQTGEVVHDGMVDALIPNSVDGGTLQKSHVKAHASHTKTGTPYQVQDYDNKVVKKPTPAAKPKKVASPDVVEAVSDAAMQEAGVKAKVPDAKAPARKAPRTRKAKDVPAPSLHELGKVADAALQNYIDANDALKKAESVYVRLMVERDRDPNRHNAPPSAAYKKALKDYERLRDAARGAKAEFENASQAVRDARERDKAAGMWRPGDDERKAKKRAVLPVVKPSEGPAATWTRVLKASGSTLNEDGDTFSEVGMKRHVASALAKRLKDDPDFAVWVEHVREFADDGLRLHKDHDIDGEIVHSYDEGEECELACALFVANWAGTSGDGDIFACTIQHAARDLFGLETAAKGALSHTKEECEREFSDEQLAGIRAYVRAVYEETQAVFKKAGIKSVPLCRGAGWLLKSRIPEGMEAKPGQQIFETKLQPLSAFSTDSVTAHTFASNAGEHCLLMGGDVPVERIWSTAATGPGCWGEAEMIVLGGEGDKWRGVFNSGPSWLPLHKASRHLWGDFVPDSLNSMPLYQWVDYQTETSRMSRDYGVMWDGPEAVEFWATKDGETVTVRKDAEWVRRLERLYIGKTPDIAKARDMLMNALQEALDAAWKRGDPLQKSRVRAHERHMNGKAIEVEEYTNKVVKKPEPLKAPRPVAAPKPAPAPRQPKAAPAPQGGAPKAAPTQKPAPAAKPVPQTKAAPKAVAAAVGEAMAETGVKPKATPKATPKAAPAAKPSPPPAKPAPKAKPTPKAAPKYEDGVARSITGWRHGNSAPEGSLGAGTFYTIGGGDGMKSTALKFKNLLVVPESKVGPYAGNPSMVLFREWGLKKVKGPSRPGYEGIDAMDRAVAIEAAKRGYDGIQYADWEVQSLQTGMTPKAAPKATPKAAPKPHPTPDTTPRPGADADSYEVMLHLTTQAVEKAQQDYDDIADQMEWDDDGNYVSGPLARYDKAYRVVRDAERALRAVQKERPTPPSPKPSPKPAPKATPVPSATHTPYGAALPQQGGTVMWGKVVATPSDKAWVADVYGHGVYWAEDKESSPAPFPVMVAPLASENDVGSAFGSWPMDMDTDGFKDAKALYDAGKVDDARKALHKELAGSNGQKEFSVKALSALPGKSSPPPASSAPKFHDRASEILREAGVEGGTAKAHAALQAEFHALYNDDDLRYGNQRKHKRLLDDVERRMAKVFALREPPRDPESHPIFRHGDAANVANARVEWAHVASSKDSPDVMDRLKGAHAAIASITGKWMKVPVKAKLDRSDAGAYYNRRAGIHLDMGSTRDFAHEYGHHIEANSPRARALCQEFRKRRTQGKAKTKMDGLDSTGETVYAVADDFIDHYVGREYPGGDTEVLSVGLENMYWNPYQFAEADPEHFNLIHHILTGEHEK